VALLCSTRQPLWRSPSMICTSASVFMGALLNFQIWQIRSVDSGLRRTTICVRYKSSAVPVCRRPEGLGYHDEGRHPEGTRRPIPAHRVPSGCWAS
jgi:hypothetical protein